MPWSALECPGVPWSALEYPGVPWSTLEYPGIPWSALECPGVPWSALEYPGVPWSTLEYPGIPWNTLEYPGVPWSALGRMGSHVVARCTLLHHSEYNGMLAPTSTRAHPCHICAGTGPAAECMQHGLEGIPHTLQHTCLHC